MNPNQIIGTKMTPATKITSSIISIILLLFLFISQWLAEIPEKVIFGVFIWLAIHIINHLYVGISELEKK